MVVHHKLVNPALIQWGVLKIRLYTEIMECLESDIQGMNCNTFAFLFKNYLDMSIDFY